MKRWSRKGAKQSEMNVIHSFHGWLDKLKNKRKERYALYVYTKEKIILWQYIQNLMEFQSHWGMMTALLQIIPIRQK